jgi:hypothetical protein
VVILIAAVAEAAPGDMPVYAILGAAAVAVILGVAVALAVSWRRGSRSAHRPAHRRQG